MQKAKSSGTAQKMIVKGKAKEPFCFTLSRRHPALHVTAKRGSKNTLFVNCATPGSRLSLEIALEPRASLAVVFVWNGKKSTKISQHITVSAGARLHLLNVTHGSCMHDTVSEVKGVGGKSSIDWIVHGRGMTKCLLSARNIFTAKDGRGDVTIRGVAEGKAKITCNGSVEIGPKASGTQAHLTEKILLLDPTARADATPSLDVKTHNIQASHSASVSRIHPEDIFYFASRGITAKKARELFIEGFLGDLLGNIHDARLLAHLSQFWEKRGK
ncbi:MAG: SufD family Fe-S cluster assembly protein [Candidatus Peregrinibacteria bacterium]